MGMPALIYRWYFGAHSLKSLERNVLRFVGIRPIRETLIGGVEAIGDAKRRDWLERLRALGREGRQRDRCRPDRPTRRAPGGDGTRRG
jgi:putative NADPH-quinone reductase